MANKRISQLTNTATAFRTGDYIAVDGTDTAKMGKDDLLRETAENTAILADAMEMGNIGMSVGSLTYTSSSSRARTPEDSPVSLMQGDKILAKNGWQFYVAYSADGNAPYTLSNWLTKFTAPSDVKVHLLARLSPEVTAEKNVITSGIFTSANSSELSVSQIKPIHDGDIRKSAFAAKLEGNGLTPVTSIFYARPNTTICISLDKVDWHVTGIGSEQYKFIIRYFKADDSASNVIALYDNVICNNNYFIQVPSDAVKMQVFLRMDVGESLTYSVCPAPIESESVPILADVMEIGNISMSVGSLTYTTSTSRARTPENKPVSLRQGDKIFAKAGWQFYVAYSSDGNAPYTVSGWLTSFIAQSNVKVHLLIRLAPEVTAEKNVITSGIFTTATSSELSVSQIKTIQDDDISKSVFTDKLDGNGTTPVRSAFYARPNTTICIVLDKVDWHVTGIEAGQYKFVIRYFKADNSVSNIIGLEDANLCDNAYFIQVPSDAVRMEVFIRMDVGESLTYCVYPAPNKSDKLDSKIAIVKGVNHRGYNDIAPENTLPAFRLSAKMGFGYVETDVQKTSDGQLVCIHDLTVDRTSDGTGNVADMTLEQLKALDFGSWKSAAYAGTKIPTFAEFLVCCRNLGLHAYIELKVGNTEQQIVQLVDAYGMKGRVSYICFNELMLAHILSHDPKARVGLLRNTVTADDITWVNNHKTDENEVFIDAVYADRANAVALCKAANIPLEVYTVTRSQISLADDYISGFTSNNCDASVVKYGEELLK
jgi:glycerophosphoryl diester phosphodiesterase